MVKDMLLILTGTIRPASTTAFLKLKDEEKRLIQYEESILFYIESGVFDKIIFCENSHYGLDNMHHLKKEAEKYKVRIEMFSFEGNEKQTALHGKGYGEGEIMEYIFANSKLLANEMFFMKITGRLKVDNIADIVKRLKTNDCYFNIPNRTHREMYDTRIYAMPVTLFQTRFMNTYDKVMDSEDIYLEKVYTEILLKEKIQVKNFPKFPRIRGVSASTGYDYMYTEWKCKIKDLLSIVHYYKVKS